MKTCAILLFLIIIVSSTNSKEFSNYPVEYMLSDARALVEADNLDLAIWYYINLYPDNKKEVLEDLQKLNIDNDKLSKNIGKSFSLYAPLDPTVTKFENGTMSLNKE